MLLETLVTEPRRVSLSLSKLLSRREAYPIEVLLAQHYHPPIAAVPLGRKERCGALQQHCCPADEAAQPCTLESAHRGVGTFPLLMRSKSCRTDAAQSRRLLH